MVLQALSAILVEGVRFVGCLVGENLCNATLVNRRMDRVLIISHRLLVPRVAIIGALLQILVIVSGNEAISIRAHSLLLEISAVLGGATVMHAEGVVDLAQGLKASLLFHRA